MAALRHPESGCPWDIRQTYSSIAPYTIEEAYEVADAIERGDLDGLRDELGDLLFQVVFHARIAEEAGDFSFEDVAGSICDKMERRHPHVFGGLVLDSEDAVKQMWEDKKAQEREARKPSSLKEEPEQGSRLAGVALNLPALTRAEKIQKRARRAGFDWGTLEPVLDKVREEIDEVVEAADSGVQSAVDEEIGDLLFAVVNLARHLSVDPETALRRATTKFTHRFVAVEALALDRSITMESAELEELDQLWDEVKALAGRD